MAKADSHMYNQAKTWDPFKGCRFNCSYCRPSFQRQSKRQMHLCQECYHYRPHCHEERLTKIPSRKIVFVCGNADIAFCPPKFTRRIIEQIKQHSQRCPGKTFYFQSKRPSCFEPFLREFPPNAMLLTTLETNRDAGYRKVSKAPLPSERYRQFKALKYPRKVVTIEPVMDFDLDVFAGWIIDLAPRVRLAGTEQPAGVRCVAGTIPGEAPRAGGCLAQGQDTDPCQGAARARHRPGRRLLLKWKKSAVRGRRMAGSCVVPPRPWRS